MKNKNGRIKSKNVSFEKIEHELSEKEVKAIAASIAKTLYNQKINHLDQMDVFQHLLVASVASLCVSNPDQQEQIINKLVTNIRISIEETVRIMEYQIKSTNKDFTF